MRSRRAIAISLLLLVALIMCAFRWPESAIGTIARLLLFVTVAPLVLVVLPLVLVVAGPPAILEWIANVRRTRRTRRGQCVSCGYERRGLAEEAPCPECGTR